MLACMQAAADLTWWQKEKLQDAAATYYQQMAFISVEGQAAATALKQVCAISLISL